MAEGLSASPKEPGQSPTRVPWWDSKLMVALAAALVAAVSPLVVATVGAARTDRELKLQELNLDQQYKMEYLRVLVENYENEVRRQVILDFMADTAYSDQTRDWALEEGLKVRESLLEKDRRLEEVLGQIDKERSRAEELQQEIRVLTGRLESESPSSTETAGLQAQLGEALAELHATKRSVVSKDQELVRLRRLLDGGRDTGSVQGRTEETAAEPTSMSTQSAPRIALASFEADPALPLDFDIELAGSILRPGAQVELVGVNFGQQEGYVVACNESTCFAPPFLIQEWGPNRIRATVAGNGFPAAWSGRVQLIAKGGQVSNLVPLSVSYGGWTITGKRVRLK